MNASLNEEAVISNICIERLYKIRDNGELMYSDNRNWDTITEFLKKELRVNPNIIEVIDWNPNRIRIPNNLFLREDLKGIILKDLYSIRFENYASSLIVYCGKNGYIDETSNYKIIEEVLKTRESYFGKPEITEKIDLWLKWTWGKLSREHKDKVLDLNTNILVDEITLSNIIHCSFGHMFLKPEGYIIKVLERIAEKYNFFIELKIVDSLLISDRDNYLCAEKNGIIFHKGKVLHL